MNVNDIDLDISKLLEAIPDDHVSFYFRASADDSKDFAYAKGDLEDMVDALGNILKQSETLQGVFGSAYFKSIE